MARRIARQLASLLKLRLSRLQTGKGKARMAATEEELDNLANEALEAVLGCT